MGRGFRRGRGFQHRAVRAPPVRAESRTLTRAIGCTGTTQLLWKDAGLRREALLIRVEAENPCAADCAPSVAMSTARDCWRSPAARVRARNGSFSAIRIRITRPRSRRPHKRTRPVGPHRHPVGHQRGLSVFPAEHPRADRRWHQNRSAPPRAASHADAHCGCRGIPSPHHVTSDSALLSLSARRATFAGLIVGGRSGSVLLVALSVVRFGRLRRQGVTAACGLVMAWAGPPGPLQGTSRRLGHVRLRPDGDGRCRPGFGSPSLRRADSAAS